MNRFSKTIIINKRKFFRRLNWRNIYYSPNLPPKCIVAGYTRSGTTFISNIIAGSAGWKMIHEPFNPSVTLHIRDRDSSKHISESTKCREEIGYIFGGSYRGSRVTNNGGQLFYSGELIKIVRANFYLDKILNVAPNTKLIYVVRNPYSCVVSRMNLGWQVPDMTNCIEDIADKLTKEQYRCYGNESPYHVRVAATWCMDNMKALADIATNRRAKIIQYDNFVDNPIRGTREIFDFLNYGDKVSLGRIQKENQLLEPSEGLDIQRVKYGWRNSLSSIQQSEIFDVLRIYDLTKLLPVTEEY